MTKYCIYCGSSVRDKDKFCITCGKPLLSDIPKEKDSPKVEEAPLEEVTEKKEKKSKKKEILDDIDDKIEEEIEIKESSEPVELPDNVKQQLDLYIELSEIKVKRKLLADKLKGLQKSLKDDRYETDFEFAEGVNAKLEAFKAVSADLSKDEATLKNQMDNPFIVDKLRTGIETKRSQLTNLMREHKLKKIKDKDVVANLKDKYKQQKVELETELTDLILGIKSWIVELESQKAELIVEQKTNKARYSAKEISEEEFKSSDEDYDKNLKKMKSKIEVLVSITKDK